MFNLPKLAGLAYASSLIFVGLFVIISLITIFWTIHFRIQKSKSKFAGYQLLRKCLDENKLTNVELVYKKFVLKNYNYNVQQHELYINKRQLARTDYCALYNVFFHFVYAFQSETKVKKSFKYLKFFNGLSIFALLLFCVSTVLTIVYNTVDSNSVISDVIEYISLVNLFLIILAWYGHANCVESYGKDLVEIATEQLGDEIKKPLRWLVALKSISPLSELYF